jgi:hypothetical protein
VKYFRCFSDVLVSFLLLKKALAHSILPAVSAFSTAFANRSKLLLWLLLSYTLPRFYTASLVCKWSVFSFKGETTSDIVQGVDGHKRLNLIRFKGNFMHLPWGSAFRNSTLCPQNAFLGCIRVVKHTAFITVCCVNGLVIDVSLRVKRKRIFMWRTRLSVRDVSAITPSVEFLWKPL